MLDVDVWSCFLGCLMSTFILDATRYTSFLQSVSLPKTEQWLDLPHSVRGALHLILIAEISELSG